MRYWRYHSKHVLTNAFDLVGAAAAREDRLSDERPVGWKAGPTKGRSDERPARRNDCGRLVYSIQ